MNKPDPIMQCTGKDSGYDCLAIAGHCQLHPLSDGENCNIGPSKCAYCDSPQSTMYADVQVADAIGSNDRPRRHFSGGWSDTALCEHEEPDGVVGWLTPEISNVECVDCLYMAQGMITKQIVRLNRIEIGV